MSTVTKEYFPASVSAVEILDDGFIITCENQAKLHVKAYSDHIVRFRYNPDPFFLDDFSYALQDSFLESSVQVDIENSNTSIVLSTKLLTVEVDKWNVKVVIKDKDGNILNEDEKGFHWEKSEKTGNNIVQMTKKSFPNEAYYGLGDKSVKLNLKGKRFHLWGFDAYGYEVGQDPLYRNIPFYITLNNGIASGVFFDNSFRTNFDFGSERKGVTSFWADGGEMNYYFIHGPELMEVTKQYSVITGLPELPPMWALGYHQCKWSYYPESKVKYVTDKFRELSIPCDAIYLDIDYMDGFRCFTWDNDKFPDPKRMVKELKENGFKTVAIIDPGIKVDINYDVFKEGLENDYFCKRNDGNYMQGKVWPGECFFPDFTKPEVRDWWAGLFKGLIEDVGIAGIWNDMNEPAVMEVESKTFPDDVRFDYDGHPCSHLKAHNVYGTQMVRATRKGLQQFGGGKRPFAITRSAYAGAQRYTSTWTGDNKATWDHLWCSSLQCMRLSISGFSFVGSDIGGFVEQPSSELFVRWIQVAAFHVFCRTHSDGHDGDQEPWSFGSVSTSIARDYISLRYKFLPYLYTSFYQHVQSGMPILRPLIYEDQTDKNFINDDDNFLHGDHLLICPVIQRGAKSKEVYLPKGKWYHYWTGNLYEGQKTYLISAPMDEMPIFIRAGAVIPHYPVMNYVGEKVIETLELKVYFNSSSVQSQHYEDAGDGYDYKNDDFLLTDYHTSVDQNSFLILKKQEGTFNPSYQNMEMTVIGLPNQMTTCLVDGKSVAFDKNENEVKLTISSHFKEIRFFS